MGQWPYKILVVEDEPDIRKLVNYNLTQERITKLSKPKTANKRSN